MRYRLILPVALLIAATVHAAPQQQPAERQPAIAGRPHHKVATVDWLLALATFAAVGALRRPRSTRSVSS